MNWFRRNKKEQPVHGSAAEQVTEIPFDLDSLEFDRLARMSSNVMWCRENLDAMLEYIDQHRSDGHECPPFCLPPGITTFLGKVNKDHLFMLLVVLMKDLEVSFVVPEEPAP